ncbi:glycosyl hydrolase family 28-related protein [Edaphobacter bradus]|uniref:glycosyl hydrolase family 28-related protein n=1 Tax=Edaphobacter bradus TaxID=2259016 RepID=UPI0021E01F33|nr:glycosyl hydrolase family 28-related protein [Edaphobacter bradus]
MIIWAHDDTRALQNAYAAAVRSGKSLYIPPGKYLHHGLNWTNNSIKIYGEGYGATMLYAIDVTNPGATTIGAQTTGIDLSGSGYNQVSDLGFVGGYSGFVDMAPVVNVLGARVGATDAAFAIAHIFDNDFFLSFGAYDVALYGYEQTDFKDCQFESQGPGNLGLLYLSAANTPGLKSPYAVAVPAPTSMTKLSVNGARSAFSGSGKAVVFDQGATESNYTIAIRDAYANISDGGTFLSDTGVGALRHIELDQVYVETGKCQNCKAIDIKAPAWNWQIRNVQIYNDHGYTVSPFNFARGLLDSEVMIDATGQAGGFSNPELNASSCAGSVLHLGQEQPSASCTDSAMMTSVNGTSRK